MTLSLNTIRDRVRIQLEDASGLTEPLRLATSSATLANVRDRVELRLQDTGNATWAEGDLDEAIETALEQYSKYNPQHAIDTVTLGASDAREIDISSLTGLLRVEKVWWDYDSSDPSYPPNWRQFEVWPGDILYIDDRELPAENDVVRVWYTKMHTINGLDGDSTTTIPADDEGTIVTGAAHFAAQMRIAEIAEDLPAHDDALEELRRYADEQGRNFRYQAQLDLRAYVERARAYAQGDIDEAIRWALYRFNEVKPHRAVTTIELSSDGREIDISSITYIDIERVWLDYDSSDPDHPPKWADFEVWPGDLLFTNEPNEPDSGDVLRIWYTCDHTINGLDSATATTILDRDANIIVVGAAGFAAQERIQEEEHYWGKRDLREWGAQRLLEFEQALARIARREGSRHSGVAPTGDLDRWDGDWA
jgi:hypothetical protein